jgi:YD repeat-containing protein
LSGSATRIVSITDPLDVISSGPATATYAYPGTSNRLASITPDAGAARSFGYDAMGNIISDTRGAGPAMSFEYDVEGRLAHAYQTATPAEGGTYAYDSRRRLASRTVSHASRPSSTTALYLPDLDDHVIAETDASGNTLSQRLDFHPNSSCPSSSRMDCSSFCRSSLI